MIVTDDMCNFVTELIMDEVVKITDPYNDGNGMDADHFDQLWDKIQYILEVRFESNDYVNHN